ncbi:hypothetical protein [Fibrobacter sp.]|uniref:hypothetical protein n=1 Tax=Fibrobacter sp. TaxID=35828 RepID=UPI00386A8FD0
MKKVLTTAAALSLMLIACADDSSSSTAPAISGGDSSSSIEESSSSENSSSATTPLSSATIESSSSEEIESSSSAIFTIENQVKNLSAKCMYSNAEVAENDPAEIVDGPGGLPPVSTITIDVNEGFVTVTLDVGDIPCGSTYENIKVSVENDTLLVVGDFIDSYADCICPTVVSFDVKYDPAFTAANYTKFNNQIVLPLHEIDPSIAQELEPSYSMVTKAFDAECKDHLKKTVEESVDFNDDDLVAQIDTAWKTDIASRETLVAWYINGDGMTTIVIDEVDMACGTVFTGFDVEARGETLYVEPKIDPASPIQRCLCPTRISLEIEQHPNVGSLNYLMFAGSQRFVLAEATSKID